MGAQPRLPLVVSVPHPGLIVPAEVAQLCVLTPYQVRADSDEGADVIYESLRSVVAGWLTTDTARVIVDLNRAQDDRRPHGVIKRRTFYKVPVYRSPPPSGLVDLLLARYWRPYHEQLRSLSAGCALGVDCHTMAEEGPPVSPHPGVRRPAICLGNAGVTCPRPWLKRLAECLRAHLGATVALNKPFRGGYITRSRPGGIPWVQLELSREPWMSEADKGRAVAAALADFCRYLNGAPGV